MEENGGNEGKDLAVFEKAKAVFEDKVYQAIFESKGNSDSIVINNITLKVKKVEDGVFSIGFGENDTLFTMDSDKNFTYNLDQLREYEEARREGELGMANMMDSIGLPDLDYLEYLEQEKNRRLEEEQRRLEEKENGEREESEGDEREREEGQRKDNDEGEGIEEEQRDGPVSFHDALEAKAKELNMSTRELRENMTELDVDRNKVTGDKTLGQLLGIAGSRIFVVKVNETNWKLVATDANGNLYDLAEQTEVKGGMNNRTRTSLEGERGVSQGSLQETQYLAEFSVKGDGGAEHRIAIQREGQGSGAHIQALYGRAQTNRGINDEDKVRYVSIATEGGHDRTQESLEIRESIDPKRTGEIRYREEAGKEAIYKKFLENNPEIDPDGIQPGEYDLRTNKEELAKKVAKHLKNEGMDFPGQAETLGEEVASRVFDEGDTREINEIVRAITNSEREEGGITPGDKGKRV